MASGSGGSHPEPGGCGAECESCRSAPGIPFCRVEWSFLCTGCAAVVHANNWIIAVPPNPNPNSAPIPIPYPHPFPNPNLDPSAVVQLSSSDDSASAAACGGSRKRRRGGGKAPPPLREESVMRYREKRKSRRFEKTVRYESRKVYAEQRPRVDGKFARPVGSSAEGGAVVVGGDESGLPEGYFQAMASAGEAAGQDENGEGMVAGEAAGQDESGEGMAAGGEELRMLDVGEELRLR